MTIYQFHTAVDEYLAKALAKLPPDQQPCCARCTNAYCCSEPAYCDATETKHMLEVLTPEQLARVAERTRQWRVIFETSDVGGDEETSAFKYRALNLPCPFLEEGRCTAYARRPMACREFFALGHPEDCAMPARIHQKYATYPHPNGLDFVTQNYYLAEVQRVGYLELDHIGAHLVRMVLGHAEFTTASHQRVEVTE